MYRKVFCCYVLVSWFLVFSAHAENKNGGYAGPSFQFGKGARAVGMGGAFVAVADDATTGFWNPAGLTQLEYRTFGASFRKMALDRKIGYLAYLQPIKGDAALALGWINSGVSDVKGRNDRGEVTGEIDNSENIVVFSFALPIKNLLVAGGSAKYVQYNLEDINANTIGFDIGTFFKPYEGLRVGLVGQNLGMKYTWNSGGYWQQFGLRGSSTKERFPVNFKLGVSYKELKDKLLASFQLEKTEHQDAKLSFGSEYWIVNSLAVRAGYNRGSLTLGFGLLQKFGSTFLGFDYAYSASQVDIDDDHIFSLQVGF